MNCIDLAQDSGKLLGCCEFGNEHSDSIKPGDFLKS